MKKFHLEFTVDNLSMFDIIYELRGIAFQIENGFTNGAIKHNNEFIGSWAIKQPIPSSKMGIVE